MKNPYEDKRGCLRSNRINKEIPQNKCGNRHSKMTPEELGAQQSKCSTQEPKGAIFGTSYKRKHKREC